MIEKDEMVVALLEADCLVDLEKGNVYDKELNPIGTYNGKRFDTRAVFEFTSGSVHMRIPALYVVGKIMKEMLKRKDLLLVPAYDGRKDVSRSEVIATADPKLVSVAVKTYKELDGPKFAKELVEEVETDLKEEENKMERILLKRLNLFLTS